VAPLSPIEARILELYRQGKSYKEIMAQIPVRSINTLKTHCRRIILKTLCAANLRAAAWLRFNSAVPAPASSCATARISSTAPTSGNAHPRHGIVATARGT
jgi:DNA-binding CsgD family transcriptional regulator